MSAKMPPDPEEKPLNTTPSLNDDSHRVSHEVDQQPRHAGYSQTNVLIETSSDDDPDSSSDNVPDTIDTATQVSKSRGVTHQDMLMHSVVARSAHSTATLKASTEKHFGELKDVMDENFDKLTVAMNVMQMTTKQNGTDITEALNIMSQAHSKTSDAIDNMSEVNAKSNITARNTSAQLEALINQMTILNQSICSLASPAATSNSTPSLVPSQTINNN